jgi:hypothetical protein
LTVDTRDDEHALSQLRNTIMRRIERDDLWGICRPMFAIDFSEAAFNEPNCLVLSFKHEPSNVLEKQDMWKRRLGHIEERS